MPITFGYDRVNIGAVRGLGTQMKVDVVRRENDTLNERVRPVPLTGTRY